MKKLKISFLMIICSSIFMLSVPTVWANEDITNVNGEGSSTMTVTGNLAPESSSEPSPDDGDDKIPNKDNVNIPRQQVHVNTLPKTGENHQSWLFSLGGLSILFVVFLALANQRKKQYEKNR